MSSRHKATPRKPKAAREAERQARQLPPAILLKNLGKATALLILAGFSSPVSQLSLSPVYGSIPASLHHQRSLTITCLLAVFVPKSWRRRITSNTSDYISVIAYWIPLIHYFLFRFSGTIGIEYGPLYTELVTYFPLLFLSVYSAIELLEGLDRSQLPKAVGEAINPIASYVLVSTTSKIFASTLPGWIGTHLSFTRVGLQMLVASMYAMLSPSLLLFAALPAVLHTMLANPHYPSDKALSLTNSTLYNTQNYTILARQESLTGYISVLENVDDSAFRLLRCDHSLLGGEWQLTPASRAKGQTQTETIFSVFVMLEAVRLVEDDQSDVEPIPDSEKSALVIGLGIGTAPKALIGHGINTTIVELDPVVHYYATKYFDLPKNHTAVIDDAVSYVSDKSTSNPGSYNYIIHDVFTGGAEPVSLFTQEFFQGLKDLLTDDGVVAINYAGDLSLGSTRLVLNTIHSVFPACRLFRDSAPPPDLAPGDPDFINMVVFCVKNDQDKGKFALIFREADEDDFRGSIARQNMLRPKEELEIQFDYVPEAKGGKVMRRGDIGELEKYHKKGAVSHWRIMRTVLPAAIWESW